MKEVDGPQSTGTAQMLHCALVRLQTNFSEGTNEEAIDMFSPILFVFTIYSHGASYITAVNWIQYMNESIETEISCRKLKAVMADRPVRLVPGTGQSATRLTLR